MSSDHSILAQSCDVLQRMLNRFGLCVFGSSKMAFSKDHFDFVYQMHVARFDQMLGYKDLRFITSSVLYAAVKLLWPGPIRGCDDEPFLFLLKRAKAKKAETQRNSLHRLQRPLRCKL